jgi:CTP synthase (UTP-ammonia lyase)
MFPQIGDPETQPMHASVRIGLIGDYNAAVAAHQAIPIALQLASDSTAIVVSWEWVPTEEVRSIARVSAFNGLWCVAASPYRDMEGALLAIQYAREAGRPFLGICGGFQHVILEYARNVLKWTDAAHAEVSPEAAHPVIAPLTCALVEVTGSVRFPRDSRIARAYGSQAAMEGYHCRYGLSSELQKAILSPGRFAWRQSMRQVTCALSN